MQLHVGVVRLVKVDFVLGGERVHVVDQGGSEEVVQILGGQAGQLTQAPGQKGGLNLVLGQLRAGQVKHIRDRHEQPMPLQ